MPVRRRERLTYAEAQRALYIDFEGRKDAPPVLLGCLRRAGSGDEPTLWQAVLDPSFAPLAEADGILSLSLTDAVERIVRRAKVNDRLIVSWSEHELRVVQAGCPDDLFARFERRFVNARHVAARWARLYQGERRPDENSLSEYLALIGYGVPAGAGPGRVGETIGIISNALAKGQGVAGLTTGQGLRWRQLRDHNAHDCAGMKRVCLRAARELETAAD